MPHPDNRPPPEPASDDESNASWWPGGRSSMSWVLLILATVLLVSTIQRVFSESHVPVSYAEWKHAVAEGDVDRVELSSRHVTAWPVELEGEDDAADDADDGSAEASATSDGSAEGSGAAPTEFDPDDPALFAGGPSLRAVRVAADESLVPLLESRGIDYRGVPEDGCAAGLLGVLFLPTLLFIAFWLFVMRRANPNMQAMSFGKARARSWAEEDVPVRFDDVAGVDEAREELEEVVQFLREPERFRRLGARIPRGVMLVGPPGTGKTLLARAVAGEAGVAFMSISGSDFVEMFVGVGASRVRDLFEQAREKAPAIIFLDELDAVGKARGGGGVPGGNDEREQTLNALLVEMDGFDHRTDVIVLAATNRPESLDPALLRPGRFDRQVLVDRPDRIGRIEILKIHAAKIVLADDIDVERIAQQTTGFVGADLANVVNEAALLAAREDAAAVAMSHFQDAIERVIAGLERKSRRLNPVEKEIVAYHECGHAIVARALPTSDPVRRISIVPRGMGALGYTLQVPLEDRFLMTQRELGDRIGGLLGGRAAEQVIFGEVSTGAHDDLRRATDIARRMLTEYGMDERLGLAFHGETRRNEFLDAMGGGAPKYSGTTAEVIDEQVHRILDDAWARAQQILETNRELLVRMSLRLLEIEVLDDAELDRLLADVQMLDDDAAWLRERDARAAARPPIPTPAPADDDDDADRTDSDGGDASADEATPAGPAPDAPA